jgi:hypothetical protein
MDYLLEAAAVWLILNAAALWLFQGGWRTAALVSAGAMGLAIAVAGLGVMAGSDLAPIWVVFALPVCLVWIVVLWLVRGVVWAVSR